MEWRLVSDSFGRPTRAALLSTLVTNVAAKATQPRKLELIETNTLGHYDLVVQAWLPQRTRSPTTKTPRTAAVSTIHSSTFSTKNSLRSDLFTFLDVAGAQ